MRFLGKNTQNPCPERVFPDLDFPHLENRPPIKTDLIKTNKRKNKREEVEEGDCGYFFLFYFLWASKKIFFPGEESKIFLCSKK
jgi:hypothetical protein